MDNRKIENIFSENNRHAFIITEVGLNHNGDFGLAVKLVEAAAKAGTDAVKFQNFKTEDFIFDRTLTYTYQSQGKEVTESMWDLCKRYEMKRDWLPNLKKLCDDLGIFLISTPTSEAGVNDLVKIGVKMLKNGSDFLNHLPLLRHMGTTGLTVIISTGMADKSDVKEAIDAVRSGGPSRVVLLHCTSSYPTKNADVNLSRMITLRDTFNVPVGFSDHTLGPAAAIQAVTLGACILEKHFTLDHNLPGPDHWFSIEPDGLKQYILEVRDAEQRIGSKNIEPSESEKLSRNEFRLSILASRDLFVGQLLKEGDFVIAKPGTGSAPKESERITGKKLAKDVKKGTPLLWGHFK